jgi:hypothetical protein
VCQFQQHINAVSTATAAQLLEKLRKGQTSAAGGSSGGSSRSSCGRGLLHGIFVSTVCRAC